MAPSEPYEPKVMYYGGRNWVFQYSETNSSEWIPVEDKTELIRKKAAKLTKEALGKLADQFKITMRPLVLYVRRFVDRQQPRWSSLRWKAKT